MLRNLTNNYKDIKNDVKEIEPPSADAINYKYNTLVFRVISKESLRTLFRCLNDLIYTNT
jgi:hypothetical protein